MNQFSTSSYPEVEKTGELGSLPHPDGNTGKLVGFQGKPGNTDAMPPLHSCGVAKLL